MDKYKSALINSASKLDAITDSCRVITKLAASSIEKDNKTVQDSLLTTTSELADN